MGWLVFVGWLVLLLAWDTWSTYWVFVCVVWVLFSYLVTWVLSCICIVLDCVRSDGKTCLCVWVAFCKSLHLRGWYLLLWCEEEHWIVVVLEEEKKKRSVLVYLCVWCVVCWGWLSLLLELVVLTGNAWLFGAVGWRVHRFYSDSGVMVTIIWPLPTNGERCLHVFFSSGNLEQNILMNFLR